MEIRYVKEFTLLAESLSFSLAAEQAFVSQSSLSKHIQKLEQELGTALFYRTSKSVALTEFGRRYLPHAQQIVAAYEGGESVRQDYLKERENTLVIGVVENLQIFGIHQYLIAFRGSEPSLRLKIVEASNDKLYSMFREHELNVFTSCLGVDKALDHPFYPLFFGRIVACCPAGHALSAHASLSLADLCDEPLILPPQETRFYRMIEASLQSGGLHLTSTYDCGYEAAISFVRSGMGIALLPSEAVSGQPLDGVSVRPLEPMLAYRCGVECREPAQLCAAEKAFIRYITRLRRKMAAQEPAPAE